MAKVRVYELAKEFNMTNKAFMDKLEEIEIKARSHMSSLEDEQVSFIKNRIFGKGSAVSEIKIRPSVIRRRKAKGDQEPSTIPSEPSVTEENAAKKAIQRSPMERSPSRCL